MEGLLDSEEGVCPDEGVLQDILLLHEYKGLQSKKKYIREDTRTEAASNVCQKGFGERATAEGSILLLTYDMSQAVMAK